MVRYSGTPDCGPPPDVTDPTGSLTAPTSGSTTNPNFTLSATARDNSGGSGVDYVEFFANYDGQARSIGTDRSEPYGVTWDASSISDQEITFGIRVYDNAGNRYSKVLSTKVKLDTTAPPIPAVTCAGVEHDTWQNSENQPSCSWELPADNLSGFKDYLLYWGGDQAGTGRMSRTATSYTPDAPCPETDQGAVCHLRMATRDQAGNTSSWRTVFTLRYDNQAPTGDMTLNYGWGIAHGVGVPLDLNVSDKGGGVREVRLGSTCDTLGDWQVFQQRLWWQLDGQHGDTANVCVQYRDRAGNVSDTVDHSVPLDFYPALPASARYRLAREVQASNGNIGAMSERYQMHSTGGQSLASSSPISSTNYQATLGFWPVHSGEASTQQTSITLTAERTNLPADGVSTTIITATVRAADGQTMPNQTVTFATTLGTINPTTTTADANGVSTAILQAGTTPGTATVRATAGTAQDTIDIRFGNRDNPASDNQVYLPVIQR
jgi:hypothetical protein